MRVSITGLMEVGPATTRSPKLKIGVDVTSSKFIASLNGSRVLAFYISRFRVRCAQPWREADSRRTVGVLFGVCHPRPNSGGNENAKRTEWTV